MKEESKLEPLPFDSKRKKKQSKKNERSYDGEKIAQARSIVSEKIFQALEMEPHEGTPDIRHIAMAIEEAIYEAFKDKAMGHCSPAYKTKYMSLLFNLKDPKNHRLRSQILDGSLSPAALIKLKPVDLANEELSQMIREVRENSVQLAVLEDDLLQEGLVRKTHKGEEPLKTGSFDNDQHDISMPLSVPMYIPEYESPSEGEDEQDRSFGNPSDWEGLVLLQDISNFYAKAKGQADLPYSIKRALPASMHISGRLDPANALAYLTKVMMTPSRSVSLLNLEAEAPDEPGTKGHPGCLSRYLTEADRWAVISINTSSVIKDIYLVPGTLGNMDQLASIGIPTSPSIGYADNFLMVIVSKA